MKTSTILLCLPALGLAFPGMMGGSSKEEMLHALKERRDEELAANPASAFPIEKRQGIVGSLLTTVLSDVKGLLGSVASSIDPNNKRPEPGYTFKAPGAGDSRGPCPGLNLLANYGYLPRNGYVTYAQVVDATSRGFNMAADLSTVLAVFSILANGDPVTESFYLGAGPGNVGGPNRHDTVECDVSPNREDYYLGCGDNHHLSSRLFRQNVGYAIKDPAKQFTLDAMGNQYAANAAFSLKNNPYLYYFPFPSIVSLGAFAFYPNFFSNGTYRAGGVANYESISSIIGAKLNEKTGQFEYVPERWPAQGWYRRATPYGAVTALADILSTIYPKYPLAMPFAQLGNPDNLTPATILCDIYSGLNFVTPLALGGAEESTAAGISWALSKLVEVGLGGTALGCPASELSPNTYLYPNASQPGGPLNLPPTANDANSGNDVFGKTYFCNAPTSPQCSHTC